MGPTTYTEWQLGEKTVGGMMPQDGDTPAGMPSFWLTYFAVADTDASLKQAEELGASMVMAPMDIPTGRFAVVKDPHGALFGIIALAAK
jgi:predicted enzyme related to lactoylglutathione lyase